MRQMNGDFFALSCLPANGLDKFMLVPLVAMLTQCVYVSSALNTDTHVHVHAHTYRNRRNECVRWRSFAATKQETYKISRAELKLPNDQHHVCLPFNRNFVRRFHFFRQKRWKFENKIIVIRSSLGKHDTYRRPIWTTSFVDIRRIVCNVWQLN